RELLYRLDRLGEQPVLPPLQARPRPVTVRALDMRGAIPGDLGEQVINDRGLGVVGVDQYREPGRVLAQPPPPPARSQTFVPCPADEVPRRLELRDNAMPTCRHGLSMGCVGGRR